jgi:microsomal dipeptidase-like Zn-dependent dipeptidase
MKIAPHEGWSEWIRTPAGMQNIILELERRGFASVDIAKIMGGNWLRLFRQTFAPAADANR